MTGRALTNATYQISSGKAKFASQYTVEEREMICRLFSYGHTLPTIKALEKKHPGELACKVVYGIQAVREGQGKCRFTTTTDSEGHTWMHYDKKDEVAEIITQSAKPPKRKPPLPSPANPKKKSRNSQKCLTGVKPEPLEEDSFLIRVDDNDDELHMKVVERLRGKGYTVTKDGSSSSSSG